MTIKNITEELLKHVDILGYNANVYNYNGQPIDYIIMSENNDIILLTDKQYKRLLKEKRKEV